MFDLRTRGRLLALGAVAVVAIAGCGSAATTDETAGGGASPAATTARSDFCVALDAVRGTTYDLTASTDAKLLGSTSDSLDEAMSEAREEAPDGVEGALDVWFAEIEDFQALLREHDFDMEKVPFDAWAEARVSLDSPEVTAAKAEIADVAGEDCLTPQD